MVCFQKLYFFHTMCLYIFLLFSQQMSVTLVTFLYSIKSLVFIKDKSFVICEVRTEVLYIMQTNANLQRVKLCYYENLFISSLQRRKSCVCVCNFSLLQNVQTGCGAHPASYSMSTGVIYRGKATGA